MLNQLHTTDTLVSITLVLAALAARPSPAQEFSADIVQTPAKGTSTTRVYAGTNRVRLESLENGQPAGAIIWDGSQNTTTIVLDRQQAYIGGNNSALVNATLNRSGTPAAWRLFHPMSTSDPCTDWNALTQQYARHDSTPPPHATCRSLGNDVVNGRPAQKWAVTSTENGKTQTGNVWVDSKLHVVTRTQDDKGEMDLTNIKEGPQPDAEFVVPAGYRAIDPTAVLANMKPGQAGDSTLGDLLGAAAKDAGKSAATEATRAKVRKGLKGILGVP